jgi:hypothetical protein
MSDRTLDYLIDQLIGGFNRVSTFNAILRRSRNAASAAILEDGARLCCAEITLG